MSADAARLAGNADRAAAAGDHDAAIALLEQLTQAAPSVESWIKLASMRTARGQLVAALDAVHQALALEPLDFMALLSKASLLERMGVAGFGEAFGRALAQMPDGPLPPSIARMVDHARGAHATFVRDQEGVLSGAAAQVALSPEEARRMDRFRSNVLRQTPVFHSEPSHFHFPGLVEREFHDREAFPWLAELEAATDTIAAEFAAVVAAQSTELVPYIRYAAHEPLMQWAALNHNRDWTAIHLSQYGRSVEANARHCPETVALLERLPQPRIDGCSPNAVFSLLAPGTHIPPHTGVSNTRLLCHLPLIVPDGCWFRVGAETRAWERGKAFVFDDTIEHEAANPSDKLRVVLIFDIWHPGLSPAERDAVRLTMEAGSDGAALAL